MKTSAFVSAIALAGLLLTVAPASGQAPHITAQPQHQVRVLRGDVQFSATASVPGLSKVWLKNGSPVSGSSGVADSNGGTTLSLGNLATSSAGIYRARFTTPDGNLESDPAYLGIITSPAALTNVKAGTGITLTCTATVPPGCTATFRWLDDSIGGPNIANGGVISGADTKTIKITNLTTALETGALAAVNGYVSGNSALVRLRCRVTMTLPASLGGATVNGLSITSEVNVVTPPQINPAWNLPTFQVSQPVDDQVACLNLLNGVLYSYSATGLPSGVKLDSKTGLLSGRPTTPLRDRQGAVIPYQVTFTVNSAFGKGSRALSWLVQPLGDFLIGTFTGIIGRERVLTSGLGGHCLLTVSTTGGCTGTLILHGGMKLPITGNVDALSSNSWRIERDLPLLKPALGTVRFTLQNQGGTVTGTLADNRFHNRTSAVHVGDGTRGSGEGPRLGSRLHTPQGLLYHPSLGLLIADRLNNRIARVDGGNVVTFVGGTAGAADGTGTAAQFNGPAHLAMHTDGTIYVTDANNHAVRKVTPEGVVTTLAGTGVAGGMNGNGILASFNSPAGIALDPAGNVYVSDGDNFAIRKITPAGVVTTLAGKIGARGLVNGSGASARFDITSGLAYEPISKCLYVCEGASIRRITLTGAVTTFAGLSSGGEENEGTYALTRFNPLFGIIADGMGGLYACGLFNVYHLSGGLVHRCYSDRSINLLILQGLAVADSNLYVSTFGNHRVLRLNQGPEAAVDFTLHRAAYTRLAPPPAGYVGYHTVTLRNTAPNSYTPAGGGFLMLATTSAGAATWTGRHPDGTTFTGSGPLGVSGQIALHQSFAAGRCTLQGLLGIDNTSGTISASGSVPLDSLQVTLPPGTSRLYYGGAHAFAMNAVGGRYPPAPNFATLLGVPVGFGNVRLNFQKSSDLSPFFHLDVNLAANNSITLPPAAQNPSRVTLKFDPKTGLLTGGFSFPATSTAVARTGTFAGVFAPGNGIIAGHCILPDESAPGVPASEVQITSGPMTLGPLPP